MYLIELIEPTLCYPLIRSNTKGKEKDNGSMSKKTLSIFGLALGAFIMIITVLMQYFDFTNAYSDRGKAAMEVLGLLVFISGIILFFWRKKRIRNIMDSGNYSWTSLFGLSFCAACFYVISEWVFIVTKPSFLSSVPALRKLGILQCTSALLAGLAFLGLSFFYALYLIPWFKKSRKILLALASLVPVSIISSLVLLLIDNFTYTLFNFGIATSVGIIRCSYSLVFISLFIYIFYKIQTFLSKLSLIVGKKKKRRFIIPILVVFIVLSFILSYRNNNAIDNLEIAGQPGEEKYPNIVLITGDGINADHMSVYGYQPDTTPRLNDMVHTSLVAENAFPNSSTTTAAILSIYTSKYPAQTRVLYPPDILRNNDSYQHLPGILKSLGYYSAEFTEPHWADSYDENLLYGFDYANGRSIKEGSLNHWISRKFLSDYSYFIYETSNRIFDRLEHIFFIKPMINQQPLIQGTARTFNDQEKIDHILRLFTETERPVFIHLHWMGTHGPTFDPKNQVFSAGKNVDNQGEWEDAFYDDSILEFDQGVGQIVDFLKSKDIYENTIIIISSDHGQQHTSTSRIPLLIHFPYGEFSGIRKVNIQQVDIAPTLLAYLGIKKPSWMAGDSFLSGELRNRPIYSARVGNVEINTDSNIIAESVKPPFYQFYSISVVYCNSWFELQLVSLKYQVGQVEGYPQPCPQNMILNDQFTTWIIGHLKENGFDPSKIELEFKH
jgi:hypothetical protein